MSPAATKTAKPDIVLLANSEGEVREVKTTAETKKAPARRRSSKASAKDLTAAADELLAAADPKLAACTATFQGETGVDWTRPEARAVVAEALLRHDFGITYQAAPGHLVPCVPNRVRYVAWAAKVAGDGATSALDVGCGASCVIALLAARCRGWRVVASDSDEKACAEADSLRLPAR